MMSSLRAWALLFGIAFLAGGVLGFVPSVTPNGMLLGIFEVDSMHNYVHILSGVVALLAAASASYSRLFFQVFGVLYGIVTIVGFANDGDLMIMHVNMADNYLHLGIAAIALYLGFMRRAA